MKNTQYKFERIPHLRLFDLKSQKKSINYKKFLDMPLTFEESIAEKIAKERNGLSETTISHEAFVVRPRRSGNKAKRFYHRLAVPKYSENTLEHCQSAQSLGGIITKCDRLKTKVLTDKKLSRFEKDTSKYYEYLFELSNFNFQKYEHY
jgi:hypothetical protein